MHKWVLFFGFSLISINSSAMSIEELSQYDCQGLNESADLHYNLQTAEPNDKSARAIVLKKELKDGSFEVRNNFNGEKGLLLVQSEKGGILKMMVVPRGYDVGPEYKCKKLTGSTSGKTKSVPAVQ